MEGIIAVNDLDFISTFNVFRRKKRRYIAIMLHEIEEVVSKESEEYTRIRKAILDNVNELERALLRDLFSGDIEGTGIF